jgi:predicted RND superfamily exporter protein
MNRHLERFVSFLITARWPLFGVALLLAAGAYFPSRQVRFDRSIEHMFAPRDPLLPPYQRLKREFGGNEVVMAVYQDEHLLDPDGSGILRLAEISASMKNVAGVRDVLSLAEVNVLLDQLAKGKRLAEALNLFGAKEAWKGLAILDPNSPLAARYRELFAGYTHSADSKTAAVVCMLEPAAAAAADAKEDPRTKTIRELEAIVHKLPGGLSPGVLAGEPVMVSEGFSLLERDGQRLGTWTMLLMGLTILVLFRSLRWLVLPVVVVQWTLLITRAVLVLSGRQLSMVSSMLTAIVTVVGVAGVMHLIVEIRELRVQGLTQRAALLKLGVLLAGPILGAVLTDVSGFGSLWWASVEPIRDFGTMMVAGSFLVLPAICLIFPALALAFARDRQAERGWGEVHLGYWLMRSVDAVHARPKTVAAVAAAVAFIASLGAIRLEVETDFTHNFRRGSRIVRAYDFVETQLGGAGVWDVIVPAPPALHQEYLTRVRRLEGQLRQIEVSNPATGQAMPGLTKVLSLVDALDSIDAEPTLAALTPTPELRYQGLAAAMPTFMAALRSIKLDEHGEGRLRIMLRAAERQPAEQKRRLINEVTRLARAEFPPDNASSGAEITGFFVLLTNLIESILRDQWTTFAVSSLAILVMVWVGYRSWQYALISMIPNAVPIYVVMGLLGWAGLKMNMGAAMIAAVSMGMSVDSSIHYFSSFRHARREGKSVHAALAQCQQSVGLAMIFSTVALLIGFGVLITSEFVPTIYFGALMSLAMLGGMLGNLIVLPLLLSWTERD